MSELSELKRFRFTPGVRREGVGAVRYQTIHGYRRAYVKEGKGPAVLLIHGIGDSSDTWRPVLNSLTDKFTVVAPDLLGHGRSEKPRADYSVAAYANGMRDLLTALGIERATIVGHSMGGGVAAQFAYQFPERCERLVLISSGGVGRTVSPLLRFAAVPGVELLMPFFGLPPVKMASRLIGQSFRYLDTALGHDVNEVLAVFDSLPNTTARRAILRTIRSAIDWHGQAITMLDRAYLVEGVPTLLMWGDRDAIIPIDHARAAHAALVDSELVVFEDAGHFPHHVDPHRFVEVLVDFIERTSAASFNEEDWRRRLMSGGHRRSRRMAEHPDSTSKDGADRPPPILKTIPAAT